MMIIVWEVTKRKGINAFPLPRLNYFLRLQDEFFDPSMKTLHLQTFKKSLE